MESFHLPRLTGLGIPCREKYVAAALATKIRQYFSVFPVSVSAGITRALSVWAGDLAGRRRGRVGDEFIELIQTRTQQSLVESRLGVWVGHPLC